jgi:prepilin-type N-terminal cleavage/methylation domain-containing protein
MNPRRRAFSLVELMVTIAIVALVVAVAVPMFSRSRRHAEIKNAARLFIAHLTKARSLAAAGGRSPDWGAKERTVSAGIQIVSDSRYIIFFDKNERADGDEVLAQVIDYAVANPGLSLKITSPVAPAEVRFRSNGTLATGSVTSIVLADGDTGQQRTIGVSSGGAAKIAY